MLLYFTPICVTCKTEKESITKKFGNRFFLSAITKQHNQKIFMYKDFFGY